MTRRVLNLLAIFAALAIAAVVMGDTTPQRHIRTTVMFVIGWNAPTGEIVFVNAIPYDNLYACEEARDDITPRSNRILGYYSVCIAPTDKAI